MFKIDELIKAAHAELIVSGTHRQVKNISIDSRTLKPADAFVALKGNRFNGHDFIEEAVNKGASCIICEKKYLDYFGARLLSRLKKVSVLGVRDSIVALGDIATFHRKKFSIPVIAVTGSNGKTTTKEMIAWLLSEEFKVLKNHGTQNNNIGVPMTLLNLTDEYDIAVLELGTNHFGEIRTLAGICRPTVGVITNIGPAHLEYLGSLNGVLREKYTLIESLSYPRLAILNADDALLTKKQGVAGATDVFGVTFGIHNKCDFRAAEIFESSQKFNFVVNKKYAFTLKTAGYYNIYNALAAIAVSRLFGIDYRRLRSRLSEFQFPSGRLTFKRTSTARFIDDTYNSNPVSVKQALLALDNFKTKGRKIFVMGDMLELGSQASSYHERLVREAAKICDVLIAVGKFSVSAAKTVASCEFLKNNVFMCDSSRQARDVLLGSVIPKKDDVILVKGSRLMKMEEVLGLECNNSV